ncbi:hypothetical protein F2P81_000573 [Scophthalmus maximus]|uniref:Transmembrane protein 275 n=1 Tax=Scophthalmus maximus TaxID=52904 RepID=A0A6A4TTJ1_SCOMX|nr:hypothetical protein F2P81_000573 [Scophthalmus maximus]
MVITDRSTGTPVPKKESQKKKRRSSRPHGLPSPALCCACGLCIMLAGLNITLVGAFAFSTLVPSANPPIIIGPILLLVAFLFFGACCVCSRLPPPHSSRRSKVGGRGTGLMGHGGLTGGAAFEIETSEHTLQDTTAVQLSPTSSPGSSRASSPGKEAPDAGPTSSCKLFTMETNGPSSNSATAVYSASTAAGGEVFAVDLKLNNPSSPPDLITRIHLMTSSFATQEAADQDPVSLPNERSPVILVELVETTQGLSLPANDSVAMNGGEQRQSSVMCYASSRLDCSTPCLLLEIKNQLLLKNLACQEKSHETTQSSLKIPLHSVPMYFAVFCTKNKTVQNSFFLSCFANVIVLSAS